MGVAKVQAAGHVAPELAVAVGHHGGGVGAEVEALFPGEVLVERRVGEGPGGDGTGDGAGVGDRLQGVACRKVTGGEPRGAGGGGGEGQQRE